MVKSFPWFKGSGLAAGDVSLEAKLGEKGAKRVSTAGIVCRHMSRLPLLIHFATNFACRQRRERFYMAEGTSRRGGRKTRRRVET